jgi:hypothetical protein
MKQTKSGSLRVDVRVNCGREFKGVAYIYQPDSENPQLRLFKPIGINAVREICELPSQWRANRARLLFIGALSK